MVFEQEGDSVNINVTGPGATLALGLMFMKTNNRLVTFISNWLPLGNETVR